MKKPPKSSFTARPEGDADLSIAFAKTAAQLQAHLLAVTGVAKTQTLWLAWPKKASGVVSDLDGNIVRETGLRAGWVDFKVCAIDQTWSGLAFKRRKKEPASLLRKRKTTPPVPQSRPSKGPWHCCLHLAAT